MTEIETGDWQPTFDAVGNIPGSTFQQPAKTTFEELETHTQFVRRRYSADVAVGLGAVDTGDDFDPWAWLFGFSVGIADSLTEHTEAITTLQEVAATPATAAYVADLDAMATVPRVLVVCDAVSGTGRPKFCDVTSDDGIADGNILYRRVVPTFRPEWVSGSSQGHIYYTPIIADRNGTVDEMIWIAGADTSFFSINYYEMALCIYNLGNGNVEKVWGSGDIKDGVADTTTIGEVAVDMGITQECEAGQILFVAHQQTAPGFLQETRRLACVAQSNKERTRPILDAACYVAQNHSQGIPSSISLASLTRENRFIPWAAVSVVTA